RLARSELATTRAAGGVTQNRSGRQPPEPAAHGAEPPQPMRRRSERRTGGASGDAATDFAAVLVAELDVSFDAGHPAAIKLIIVAGLHAANEPVDVGARAGAGRS